MEREKCGLTSRSSRLASAGRRSRLSFNVRSQMNKNSAAWLALRIIGLLALGRAFLSLLSGVAETFNVWRLHGTISEAMASLTQRLILQTWVGIGIALMQCIFFAVVAFYFLRRGRAIHKLLMHESA